MTTESPGRGEVSQIGKVVLHEVTSSKKRLDENAQTEAALAEARGKVVVEFITGQIEKKKRIIGIINSQENADLANANVRLVKD